MQAVMIEATIAADAAGLKKPVFPAGAVTLDITFYRSRPGSHFGTGSNAGKLKASAPKRPPTKPDLTKLVRAAEDALKGVLWRDDGQVTDQHTRKRYGSPGAMIAVYEDEGDPGDECPIPRA